MTEEGVEAAALGKRKPEAQQISVTKKVKLSDWQENLKEGDAVMYVANTGTHCNAHVVELVEDKESLLAVIKFADNGSERRIEVDRLLPIASPSDQPHEAQMDAVDTSVRPPPSAPPLSPIALPARASDSSSSDVNSSSATEQPPRSSTVISPLARLQQQPLPAQFSGSAPEWPHRQQQQQQQQQRPLPAPYQIPQQNLQQPSQSPRPHYAQQQLHGQQQQRVQHSFSEDSEDDAQKEHGTDVHDAELEQQPVARVQSAMRRQPTRGGPEQAQQLVRRRREQQAPAPAQGLPVATADPSPEKPSRVEIVYVERPKSGCGCCTKLILTVIVLVFVLPYVWPLIALLWLTSIFWLPAVVLLLIVKALCC
jgi:hypothetical protein